MSKVRNATLSGLLAILLWSSLALLTTATAGLPAFEVLALVFGFAALFGILLAWWRGNWSELRQPLSALALTTTALFGYHALYFIALKHAPAVEANLLNYLWPLLIVLFAGFLPGVQVRGMQIAGTLLGLAGAVILVTRGSGIDLQPHYLHGYLAAVGAAVIWAAYSVLNRRHAQVPSSAIIVACAAVALLGTLAHVVFEHTVTPTTKQWGVLALMGVGPVGTAFLLWDHGTKHGDISLLGSLSYLAPLLSTLLLVFAGQAAWHWSQGVAIGLLMLGAWLSVRTLR
jgi:drug/metabolite transporter (DMT)-like permease